MAGGTDGDVSTTPAGWEQAQQPQVAAAGPTTSNTSNRSDRSDRSDRVRRRAARALLLDPADRVLLFRGGDPDRPRQTFWFTPGGGMEPGETSEQTVRRELTEELGLTEVAVGPHVWDRQAHFTFRGVDYDQHEVFHLVRCAPFAVDVSGMSELERAGHVEHRWWTPGELAAAGEDGSVVFAPPDLPQRLAELLRDGVPSAPAAVGGAVLP